MTVTARTTSTGTTKAGTTKAGSADPAAGPAGGRGRPGRVRPNRRAPIKYEQVATSLRDKVSSGELRNGDPIGSELELMTEYGVSRATARAAIDVLRAEGLIVVHMGRGSFVRRPSDRPARTHTRAVTRTPKGVYADATETDQWHAVDTVPGVGGTFRTDASADLALALGVPEYTPLFIYERLLAGPVGQRLLHRLYLPFTTAADIPALAKDPFRAPADLYKTLEKAGHALSWTEHVRARMPSPDDAGALRIADATPMLITRRTTRGNAGQILALEETRVSAEDTQLGYTLTPGPA